MRPIAAFTLLGITLAVLAHQLVLNPWGLPSAPRGLVERRTWFVLV